MREIYGAQTDSNISNASANEFFFFSLFTLLHRNHSTIRIKLVLPLNCTVTISPKLAVVLVQVMRNIHILAASIEFCLMVIRFSIFSQIY